MKNTFSHLSNTENTLLFVTHIMDDIFTQSIRNQPNLAKSLLGYIHGISAEEIFIAMDIIVLSRFISKSTKYNSSYFRSHLKSICKDFGCSSSIATVCFQDIRWQLSQIWGYRKSTLIIGKFDVQNLLKVL